MAGPFDLSIAPYAGGLFLGDYQSLVGIGNAFVPFYAAVNDGDLSNRTDVFASLVTSAGCRGQRRPRRVDGPGRVDARLDRGAAADDARSCG